MFENVNEQWTTEESLSLAMVSPTGLRDGQYTLVIGILIAHL